jgi:hypothetical protein
MVDTISSFVTATPWQHTADGNQQTENLRDRTFQDWTTSLANALQILGYRTKDNMGVVKYATGDLSSVDLDAVDAHDAATDTLCLWLQRGSSVRVWGFTSWGRGPSRGGARAEGVHVAYAPTPGNAPNRSRRQGRDASLHTRNAAEVVLDLVIDSVL